MGRKHKTAAPASTESAVATTTETNTMTATATTTTTGTSTSTAMTATETPSIDPAQTLKASRSLLSHMTKTAQEKSSSASRPKNLLAPSSVAELSETPIWLVATTKHHISRTSTLKPGKIPLPHPLHAIATAGAAAAAAAAAADDDSNGNDKGSPLRICVITTNPQRAYKNLVVDTTFPASWRARVSRVIEFGKLQKKFKTYEECRRLHADHDVFLADVRIINRLPKVLGKTFYKSTAKRPIPIDLEARRAKGEDGKRPKRSAREAEKLNICTPAQMSGEIERAVGAALVHLAPSTNTTVKIGFASWDAEHIAANVETVVKALVKKFVPQGWRGLRSVFVKGPETVALPVWMTDELWVEEKDVVADASEEGIKLLEAKKEKGSKGSKSSKGKSKGEKANIGKKRKSLGDEEEEKEEEPVKKKAKRKGKEEKTGEKGEKDTLDAEIAERKSKLKKQKAAAKKALDV